MAAEVKTKFGKTIHTFFFPVDVLFKTIFLDWVNYLIKEKLFNLDDPLFPKALLEQDKNNSFKYEHVSKDFWTSTGQIRTIFKEAFERARLTYYNPHSIRNTLVQLGERVCKTPEQFKAWSQNLGHENVSIYRQEELFNQFKGEKNE